MALCSQCKSIGFEYIGLQHEVNESKHIAIELEANKVLGRAKECDFCRVVAQAFLSWVERTFGDNVKLSLENATVNIETWEAARRHLGCVSFSSNSRANPIDGVTVDHKLETLHRWYGVESAVTSPSPEYQLPRLHWLAVVFSLVDPITAEEIHPNFLFQRCATLDNDVQSTIERSGSANVIENQQQYLGRIRPLMKDWRLFRFWKRICNATHGTSCTGSKALKSLLRLRLIDVKLHCVVMRSADAVQWVALSYLWGKAKNLTLTSNTLTDFQQPGYLTIDKVPRTIYDAMQVTALIGERYIWVDSICIMQDSVHDKQTFIPAMDYIYNCAVTTIVDAAGSDSHNGLPGMRAGSRQVVQNPFKIDGQNFVQVLGPVNKRNIGYLTESEWYTRGWTYQEGLLSMRLLIFTPEQVYWQCRKATFSEDTFWESCKYLHLFHHGWEDNTGSPWSGQEEEYRRIVQSYSRRQLTQQSDGLDALKGVLRVFERTADIKFIWGLPKPWLGTALTWPATYNNPQLRKRSEDCIRITSSGKPVRCHFPTWSWAGWCGQIDLCDMYGPMNSQGAGLHYHLFPNHGEVEEVSYNKAWEQQGLFSPSMSSADESGAWRSDGAIEIKIGDVPTCITESSLCYVVIAFWSSVAYVRMQWESKGPRFIRNQYPVLSQNEAGFIYRWRHIPQPPAKDNTFELVRLVIVGRSPWEPTGHVNLSAIMSDAKPCNGLTYRRGLIDINEAHWIALTGKTWEPIFLA